MVVMSNAERIEINIVRLQQFARCSGQPVFRWRLKTFEELAYFGLTAEQFETLLREDRVLFGYFCFGACVYVTENFAPVNGIANGTTGMMHTRHFV